MCAPLAIAGAAVSMAQAGVSFMAQQADYQNKAEAWRENYRSSLEAGRGEQRSIQLRAAQEAEAASQKMYVSHLEQAQKVAEAQVSAAEGGVSGLSVDNIVGDLKRSAALNRTTIATNAKMTALQLTEEMKASDVRTKNRINSMERPTAPSPAGLVLNLAGAAIGAM